MDAKRTLPVCTLSLLLAAVILVGCTPAGTSGTQSSLTAMPGGSGVPTSSPQRDWQTYTDPLFSFRLDVPAILAVVMNNRSPGGAEHSIRWQYLPSGGPPSISQQAFTETTIDVLATTGTPGNTYPCPAGTPITVGPDIPAYQAEELTPPPTPTPGHGASGFAPHIEAALVTGGVYITITLTGSNSYLQEHFLDRYGAIWQHILNSFVPGPAVPNTHPCG